MKHDRCGCVSVKKFCYFALIALSGALCSDHALQQLSFQQPWPSS